MQTSGLCQERLQARNVAKEIQCGLEDMGVPGKFYVQIRSLKFMSDDTAITTGVVSVVLPWAVVAARKTECPMQCLVFLSSQWELDAARTHTVISASNPPVLLAATAAARLHTKVTF